MNIALLNMIYDLKKTEGGNIHVRQFVDHLRNKHHQLWSFGGIQQPNTHCFSFNLLERNRQFRTIDLFYHRMQGSFPHSPELATQLGTAARDRIEKYHTMDQSIERLAQVINAAINRQPIPQFTIDQ